MPVKARPRPSPMPFVRIEGAVFPGEDSWSDARGRAAALTSWVFLIAKEVSRQLDTAAEHDAVATFVQTHRLSAASAFTRRIVRADVVATLVELYRASKVLTTGAPRSP